MLPFVNIWEGAGSPGAGQTGESGFLRAGWPRIAKRPLPENTGGVK